MGNSTSSVSLQDHGGTANGKKKKAHAAPAGIDGCKKKGSLRTGMIPEPDYSEENGGALFGLRKGSKKTAPSSNGVQFGEDGLVVPKKPANPCLESTERQSLHRELLFNQKIGKSVIGQKTELQKVMEKFRDEQKKKELEEEKTQNKTAFEKKLEEQANKLKLQEESEAKKSEPSPIDQPEFLRVRARVCPQAVDQAT